MFLRKHSRRRVVGYLTGVILAGGASTRMGKPKHELLLGQETLLSRAVRRLRDLTEHIMVVGLEDDLPEGVRGVPDFYRGIGPLSGIHSALVNSYDDCFVVGCDMPFFSTELLCHMESISRRQDICVPRTGPHFEPLHAVYRRTCLSHIELLLDSLSHSKKQAPRVSDLYRVASVNMVSEKTVQRFGRADVVFFNINSPEDYCYAEAFLREGNLQ